MAILTIVIPSTYYTGSARASLGLSAGEISYDVSPAVDVGQDGTLEASVLAREAPLTDVSLELSVSGSSANGPATAKAAGGQPLVVGRSRGARVSLARLAPAERIEARYPFRLGSAPQGWSETRLVLSAAELRRPVDLRFPVPTQG